MLTRGFSLYPYSMKILSAAEMQACDRATIEHYGVPSLRLMRNAAQAVHDFVRLQFPQTKRITILCGKGNNGGDGLMTARLLAHACCDITVLLLADPETLRRDAKKALQELLEPTLHERISLRVITNADEFAFHPDALEADLILDAVLGTGFLPPLRGLAQAALEWLESAPQLPPILSVDLPSGWDADSIEPEAGNAYPADAVITFTSPKPAHAFGQLTRFWYQPIVVATIGSPDEAVVSNLNLHWAGSAKAITEPVRPTESNKGMYGHVLVIGGSPGKSGAPAMAALAALRTGAGLVTAAVTPSALPLVASIAPELMTTALPVTPSGEISAENLSPDSLKALLNRITVLALGPGLGSTPEAKEFALGLLASTTLPTVADADALNAIASQPGFLAKIAGGRMLVLTPHPGEMSRLTGLSTKEIQANRLQIARDFATKNQVILVLKGSRTLIAHPDGLVAINTTGNPGMAKGGSGDLLTGMIASLLAQYPDQPAKAVEAAVYLHGLAADLTVRQPGTGGNQHTLLATDSLANLHRAFNFQNPAANGYCWLQGLPAEMLSSAAQV